MRFRDIFKANEDKSSDEHSRLYQKVHKLLPEASENQLIETACIAGLLARVAYTDMSIDKAERDSIKEALISWTNLPEKIVEAIIALSVEEIKDLAGMENHKYCQGLNQVMDSDQKYHLLESLFAIAASDGSADGKEVEEIRVITSGLLLEHKHFLSARTTVLAQLQALKK